VISVTNLDLSRGYNRSASVRPELSHQRFRIHVPPLPERCEDPLLGSRVLVTAIPSWGSSTGHLVRPWSARALPVPGNVRELENESRRHGLVPKAVASRRLPFRTPHVSNTVRVHVPRKRLRSSRHG